MTTETGAAEWNDRVMPFLRDVYAAEIAGDEFGGVDRLANLGSNDRQRASLLMALCDEGELITAKVLKDGKGVVYGLAEVRLTAQGRRAIRAWPEDGIDALVAKLG